ncbi:VirD4-like conjugal transfer protein, CD1115 family [Adlercreutzia sp. ZJ473]|uniref:VirD4-like conjugal transfer protein, CD1115 family n=1 Tax=Adlercreutzia sp. ZJ473 TaxID=2722822 RepID=UPI0015537695|nr:type IV secretory system conjugative DNA transfer family protein [Adlercreutzia sp. ZJ473]
MPKPKLNRRSARAAGIGAAGLASFAVADRLSWLASQLPGNPLEQWTTALANARCAFSPPWPSLAPADLMTGAVAGIAASGLLYLKLNGQRKLRDGVEYGSARWSVPADFKPYTDPNPYRNILLTRTEGKTINTRPKDYFTARNNNLLVEGSSGSMKTRGVVEPNLMQASPGVSYVTTDPKGSILPNVGHILETEGFRIKCLDLIEMPKSLHYNPLSYVRSESDVLKLVNVIICNTIGTGERSTEDFWTKAERLLLCALVSYVVNFAPESERNIITVLDMINMCEAREDDEEFQSPVDVLFEELASREGDCFAVRQYRKYKLAAGKTAKSILVSVGARMAPFDIQELRDLMRYDELNLDMVGDEPTALFIQTSDNDRTFDFVAAMVYTQLFNLLTERADRVHGGRLPYHVRFLLDEFANLHIPNFERLISTIRSREISATIIVQNKSQLKAIYKDHAATIIGNCDMRLFLGGRDEETLRDICEALGRETIELMNESDTRGSNRSYGQNYQTLGRELMTKDEIAVLPNDECILMVRGLRPFRSKKYDITQHPRYRQHAESDPRLRYDYGQKHLSEAVIDLDEELVFLDGDLPDID